MNSEDLLNTTTTEEFDIPSHIDVASPDARLESVHVVDSSGSATPPKQRRRNTLVRKLVGTGRKVGGLWPALSDAMIV